MMSRPKHEITVHRAGERGQRDHGWLVARHSFSFGDFMDPERMGFGALRVINDDSIAPAKGFATHPHNNMEIVTVPFQGVLEHKDSEGNEGTIGAGEIQLMSAGSGIRHSEFNASASEPVKLLQIWVLPSVANTSPGYQQLSFDWNSPGAQLIVSPAGHAGLDIKQDAYFTLLNLRHGQSYTYSKNTQGNGVYSFVIAGSGNVLQTPLQERDALGYAGKSAGISIEAMQDMKVLIIEVPFLP